MSKIVPLDIDNLILRENLPKIKTHIIIDKNGNFHPEGLFSEHYFGFYSSRKSREKYAFIDLNCQVIHPFFLSLLKKLNRKVYESVFLQNEYYYNVDHTEDIILASLYEKLSPEKKKKYNYLYGFSNVEKYLPNMTITNINQRPELTRNIYENIMEYVKNKKLYISKVIVIPPMFRPIMIDKHTKSIQSMDELNDLYVKLIVTSEKVKDSEGFYKDTIIAQIEKILLDIYEYSKTKLAKKSGLIRSKMLGKRVDFSARSVITGDSNIKTGTIGVPLKIAVDIFQPFVIYYFLNIYSDEEINKLTHLINKVYEEKFKDKFLWNIVHLKKFLKRVSKGYITNKEVLEILKNLLDRIILEKDLVVIAKRDPALHRLSLQAFKPVIVYGDSIRVELTDTSAYNADFDGDSVICNLKLYDENNKEIICHFSELFN